MDEWTEGRSGRARGFDRMGTGPGQETIHGTFSFLHLPFQHDGNSATRCTSRSAQKFPNQLRTKIGCTLDYLT